MAEIWKSPPYVSGYQSHPSFYLALLFYACQEGLKAHLHQNYCWCHHCSHDPPLIQIIPRPFHPQSIKKDHQSQGTSLRTQTSEPVLTLMDQPAIRLWVDHGGRGKTRRNFQSGVAGVEICRFRRRGFDQIDVSGSDDGYSPPLIKEKTV